jgi:hypothetical protein
MRSIFLALLLTLISFTADAVEAPAGQAKISANQILRGQFTDERQVKGFDAPMRTTGHFVIAPGHGLLWMIEKPMATTTIVTATSSAQDIGGLAIKLPIKNLRHLYDMIGGALTGDWTQLEADFVIKQSGDVDHWQMLLTARPDSNAKLPYSVISVSGGRFVDAIVLSKADGTSETLNFTNATLATKPLTAAEVAMFHEADPKQ